MGLMEGHPFEIPHEQQTHEERQKIEDEKKARKADWYKKTKKKPKTEEEENKDIEDLKHKVSSNLAFNLMETKLDKYEAEVELSKTRWLMDNHTTMDETQYDELYRLESILDIDISGKDVILRLDLDVPLSQYVPPQANLEKEKEDQSKSMGLSKGRATKNLQETQMKSQAQ